MQFDEAVAYLLSLGHETLAIKLGLKNSRLLLQSLNHPERAFPSVQIAGTNGKGSTAVFLDSICRAAKIKTGLYTSPHLNSITERIKVDGVEISQEAFALHATAVRSAAEKLIDDGELDSPPTFFEQVTAIALAAFREDGCELAILETGLGGRLDSTTAADAQVCAITPIAFDHEEYLGYTIESIAAEKAAIVRSGMQVVVAPQSPEAMEVILKRCEEVGVKPQRVEPLSKVINSSSDGRFEVSFETGTTQYHSVLLGLRGKHQIENAATAVHLIDALRTRGFEISDQAVIEGLEKAVHPGRLELLGNSPAFLLDGAHNPAGARALRDFLDQFGKRPLTIVFGAMRDKNIEEIGRLLFPLSDQLIVTNVASPRAASLSELLATAQKFATGASNTAETSNEALELAVNNTATTGMICVTGSLYLIGEVRQLIADRLASK